MQLCNVIEKERTSISQGSLFIVLSLSLEKFLKRDVSKVTFGYLNL